MVEVKDLTTREKLIRFIAEEDYKQFSFQEIADRFDLSGEWIRQLFTSLGIQKPRGSSKQIPHREVGKHYYCNKCGELRIFPDDYQAHSHSKDGHLLVCKQCRAEWQRIHLRQTEPRRKHNELNRGYNHERTRIRQLVRAFKAHHQQAKHSPWCQCFHRLLDAIKLQKEGGQDGDKSQGKAPDSDG